MFEPDTSSSSPATEPATGSRAPGEYLVVARRYRPQTFDQLLGQEHVGRALAGAISSQRVGHAYLFTGARGVGKTSAARILAKALNCVHGPTPVPCNECDSCQAIAAGDDVDVLEIDGASNRGIEEMRELRHNVSIRPSRSRFKIYIIDEVHMLTREAFNALLKTLEEPPEHVKFIFCTTEAEKIPITILSRCQRFDFAGIQPTSIAGRLQQIVDAEGVTADPEALATLARRAAGSMRDSQSLLEQLLSVGGKSIALDDVHRMLGTASHERLRRLIDHLAARDAAGVLCDLDSALGEGVDVGQIMDQLLGWLRDLMVAAAGVPPDSLLQARPAEHEELIAAAGQIGLDTILAMMQITEQALARMRYSTQGRILAELALVRMCQLADLEQLPALVEQLATGRAIELTNSPRASKPVIAPPVSLAAEAKKKADSVAEPVGKETRATAGLEPPAETGATAVGITPESAPRIWREVIERLPGIAAAHAGDFDAVATSGPNQLAVRFRTSYNKAYCERPELLARIQRELADVAGGPVRVEFLLAESVKPDVTTTSAARPVDARQRLREAANHPLVERAIQLFDARLVRIDDG